MLMVNKQSFVDFRYGKRNDKVKHIRVLHHNVWNVDEHMHNLILPHPNSRYTSMQQQFDFLKYRVNYTPLPSKILELHSPPLLC